MPVINDNIISTTDPFAEKDFEELYIASREKEGRIYSDEQVATLPRILSSHVHFNEWEIRRRSAYKLINYLDNKNRPLNVLEVGCGNGWLSAKLSQINGITVTGTDINKTELNQAKRVFGNRANLSFKAGDTRALYFEKKFDIIIFAASIQYFPSFEEIIQHALTLLGKTGEIHIMDSFLYAPGESENAKKRSLIYYNSIGCAAMAEFYYHHSLDSLNGFEYKFLYDPSALKNKLLLKRDPFPWICIRPV